MLHVAMDNLLKHGRKHLFSAFLPLFLFWKWDMLKYIRLLKRDVRRLCREKDLIPDVYSAQRAAFINRFLEYLCSASSERSLFFLQNKPQIYCQRMWMVLLKEFLYIISFYEGAIIHWKWLCFVLIFNCSMK